MTHRLAPILQQYFTTYVLTQRALSPATIRTYRDSWALLLTFLAERTQIPPYALDLAHIDHRCVTAFLDHLENERGNTYRHPQPAVGRDQGLADLPQRDHARTPRHHRGGLGDPRQSIPAGP